MRLSKAAVVLIPLALFVGTFLLLKTTCGVPARAKPAGLRVMTYNIEWFGENSSAERIANIKSVIANIDPDVIGLQEIQSRKALAQIFDDNWEIGIKDEATEFQEPGIAVRKPLKIESCDTVFKDASLDYAFPGKRDVLRAVVSTPSGMKLVFYVVHMKSRSGGRLQTDPQRLMSSGLLAGYLAAQKNEYSIVLGDFNDTPDDKSLNILETGDLKAVAKPENDPDTFMVNLCEPLWAKNMCTISMDRIFRGADLDSVVKGARDENTKFVGKEYKFPDDVAVTQIMFDQILVAPDLAKILDGEAQVYSKADALRGRSVRATRDDAGNATYQDPGTQASDHLPVFADFKIPTGRN